MLRQSVPRFHSGVISAAVLLLAVPGFGQEPGFVQAPCPAGGAGPRVVYLSERIPGACTDARELQNVIFDIGQTGTLIVDKPCNLNAGFRLPSRFTLKGLGLGSSSVIAFSHDGIGISFCQEQPRAYVHIEDLDLYGPHANGITAPNSTGIAIANQNILFISKVRVSDFHTDISGTRSYSVFIEGCNVSNNRGDNIRAGYDSNAWRIRDGIVSQAGGWGINVLGPGDADPIDSGGRAIDSSNDLLIDGVRMESNFRGAIRSNAYSTRIVNNRFEGNGKGSFALPHRAVLIESQGVDARILSNTFGGDCARVLNATTMRAFNIPAQADSQQCEGPGLAP